MGILASNVRCANLVFQILITAVLPTNELLTEAPTLLVSQLYLQ
jgi:hypothetical protein